MLWFKRIDALERELATLRADFDKFSERTNRSIAAVEADTRFVLFRFDPLGETIKNTDIPVRSVVQMLMDKLGLRIETTKAIPAETKLVKARRVA